LANELDCPKPLAHPDASFAGRGLSALAKRRHRTFAASLAIGSMTLALSLSCAAFVATLSGRGQAGREVHNFDWFVLGETSVRLGWVLDPLTAAMLVMVTFVGTLIFIYSLGYMKQDENYTRFFCFLSLFAAAMLGLVIANSLLLLFICWNWWGSPRICSSGSGITNRARRRRPRKRSSPRASVTSVFSSAWSGSTPRRGHSSSTTGEMAVLRAPR